MCSILCRILCTLLIVPYYSSVALLLRRRFRSQPAWRVAAQAHLARCSRVHLRFLGIRLREHGEAPRRDELGPRLLVGNHMSYLDVLVISSLQPAIFITSVEVEEAPGLGQMASFGASLFIERRHPRRLREDIRQIGDCLGQGNQVVLFPEGTSSNGTQVLPFKAALLTAATRSGRPIQPFCLRYQRIAGRKQPRQSDRDYICWYGDMDFAPHYLRLITMGTAEAHLHWLPIMPAGRRRDLADELHGQISRCFSERIK